MGHALLVLLLVRGNPRWFSQLLAFRRVQWQGSTVNTILSNLKLKRRLRADHRLEFRWQAAEWTNLILALKQ